MKIRPGTTFGVLALALGALALTTGSWLQPRRQQPYELRVVPSSAGLRWSSLGHPTLAANLWWLRAVQYMGEPRGDQRGWDKLYPALDLVTDLDPRHGYAYQVGGNILGSVGRVEESNALLEKGSRNVPDRYILPFQRAVNAFLYGGDYAAAGRWFERAAGVTGAPSRMRDYAVAMYVKGDAHETALTLLEDLYRQAQDEESRAAVRKLMNRAVLERDAAGLERAADRFRERYGFAPIALTQLVADGIVQTIPADPFGGSYFLDPDGRVRSSTEPRRFERPLSDADREREILEGRRRVRSAETAGP